MEVGMPIASSVPTRYGCQVFKYKGFKRYDVGNCLDKNEAEMD